MDLKKWSGQDKKLFSSDWFNALQFWFDKSFYRGRKDSISKMFETRTEKALLKIGKNNLLRIETIQLSALLLQAGVNNHIDRKMVAETLKFISKIPENNIANYCFSKIRNNKTQDIFLELLSIYGIGQKLASLYLRDLCFIFGFEPKDKKQLLCLQPVDTWVRQVAVKLGIPGCSEEEDVNAVVEPIVDYCIANHISPLLFNAGAWYVGARSFDLLVELL